jgi:hypothetical protein
MKIIVYDRIEKKNFADRIRQNKITSREALIKTLDFMDFYSKFNSGQKSTNEGIPWIVLKMKNHDKQ